MEPPRRPAPSNPPTANDPPLAVPVPDPAETASGAHTASVDAFSGTPTPREPRVGEFVGPYRIVKELGRGGMAAVYEADDTELPRRVALKVLLPATVAADPQAKPRFVREGHAQAKITHDHVITIFRVGEAAGFSYIAMPVLNGQTLSDALRAPVRPSVAEVLRIGGEIAEGLAAAHAAGLVHRDIKPSNIWLEAPKRSVKILDFGLARDPHAADNQLTLRGKVVGTPAFMSPEQAAGHAVDHRTDLWSLGVVLYQMATGRKPFAGENSLNIMAAILSVEPPAPVALVPDLPPALSGLIQRLLAKNPAGRPPSAAAVVAELEAIARTPHAPPVVVVSLPSAPAAPNPWSDIETTEPEVAVRSGTRTARPVREAEEPRRRAPRRDDRDDRDDPPRSFKWAWAVGAVAGVVLLGGLVWLAVAALSPKTKAPDTAGKVGGGGEKPPVPPPVPKQADPERTAAEALVPHAKLKLLLDGGLQERDVPVGGALPAGKFTVVQIDFEDSKALNSVFVAETFLPAVAHLKALAQVRMTRWQMELSAEHLRRLAATPAANTLERLDAQVELTHASLPELKKFKNLSDVTLYLPDPDDALFERFGELSRIELLTFYSLAPSNKLTDKGWLAVAKLPLSWLTMVRSKAAPDAFRVLTTKGVWRGLPPVLEYQVCLDLDDGHLQNLSKRPTDVRGLSFRSVDLTDAGLKHLIDVKSLKALALLQALVTEDGVKALSAARPDMTITWEGTIFGPKKKP